MSEYSEDRIDLYADDKIVNSELSFVVDDDQKAEWCIGKIREAQAEKEKWKNFYVSRLEKVYSEQDATIERMRYYLEQYFNKVPHKETKTQQSYELPSAKLVVKRLGPKYERDDQIIIEWLYGNSTDPGRYLNLKETLNWAELKKVLNRCGNEMATDDGEVVPGITVTDQPEGFRVEVK